MIQAHNRDIIAGFDGSAGQSPIAVFRPAMKESHAQFPFRANPTF